MNKKAEFKNINFGFIIAFIVFLVMDLFVIKPFIDNQIEAGEYVCEDAATFDYNVTLHLCVNESQTGHPTNSTPEFDYDLNSSERILLSITNLFILLGGLTLFIFPTVKKYNK